ncbi:MAG: hypothetical protein WAU86_05740 [Oricola sp.]
MNDTEGRPAGIDPQARFLLVRPQGGLNDTLVQVEKCRRHAARFGRVLVVDLSRSGLRLPFGELFVAGDDFGCAVIAWDDAVARRLDAVATVLPAPLAGRVSSYGPYRGSPDQLVVDEQSGCVISFDFARDHAERLLVHEQSGGGTKGFFALRRLALAPAVADEVARRLLPLGGDYDAIHVRHSDLATDYARLFARCRTLFAGRRLLVCSDSAEVKARARAAFGPDTELLGVADIPDTGGLPLHFSERIDPRDAAIDLFSDLIAMARSRTFVFTGVASRNGIRTHFSGLSVLADLLRQDPAAIRRLLGRASPDLYRVLFEAPAVTPAPSPLRFLARLDQWRWNFPARWLSFRSGVKLRLPLRR